MQTLIDQLVHPIIHLIIEGACTALAALAVKAALQLVAGLKIKLDEAQQNQLRAIVQQAAQYAEEAIEAQIKQGKGSVSFVDKGDAKMRTAIAFLNIKAPQLTPGEAETALKAELVHAGVGVTVVAEKGHQQTGAVGLANLPPVLGAD